MIDSSGAVHPLVSVVLGTFNGQAFLEQQLQSIFAQTYSPIEIIAVDDGSRDNTVFILKDYAAHHPNMKVFVNEQNLGFIKNFEKGCALSTGHWISLCDQDDFWLPDKIASMVAAIGAHPMIYCDSDLCDQHLEPLGKKISDIANYQSFYDCRQLCVFTRMYGHATLITRELFDKANPFLEGIPHDGWLAFHASLYGGVEYLPAVLVKYRQHAGNIYGVVGGKKKRPTGAQVAAKKQNELERIRTRMNAYWAACPDTLPVQKKTLGKLVRCYRNFSLLNDTRRMLLFFENYKLLLAVKKYARFRKYLFCLKMFVKIK